MIPTGNSLPKRLKKRRSPTLILLVLPQLHGRTALPKSLTSSISSSRSCQSHVCGFHVRRKVSMVVSFNLCGWPLLREEFCLFEYSIYSFVLLVWRIAMFTKYAAHDDA